MSSASIQSDEFRPDLPAGAADQLRRTLEAVGAWQSARHPVMPLESIIAAACDGLAESVVITDARLEDPGPSIIWVNRGFTLMTGYGSDEVLGRSPRIFQGPQTDRATLQRLRECLRTGSTFSGETWNYRKDGTPFLMHWTVVPVHDESGRTRCFAAVQRDVTGQRRSDRELARRTRELETISAHCPDAILRLDSEGRIVYASDATQMVLGVRPSAIRGRTVAEIGRGGPALDELVAEIDAVAATSEPRMVTVPSPFGLPERWLEIRLVPETGRQGQVEHVVWFAREVTGRIQAEQRARASEERERIQVQQRLRARELEFRDLAESVPLDIWITDEHGRDIYANRRWLAFIGDVEAEAGTGAAAGGRPEVEATDRPAAMSPGWQERINPEDRVAFDRAFSRSLEQRVPLEVECRVRRADGEERTLVMSGIPRHDGDRFLGILVTCLDITDRRRRDDMQRRALAELEHASRLTMAGQMAAAMVHEMAQPLSAMATFIEIAVRELEGGRPQEQVVASLRDAQGSALRAGELSRRMLGFVRRSESNSSAVDLGDCVGKGIGLMKADAGGRRVSLVDGGGLDGVMVVADAVELEQVVCNLIRNAVEAISGAGTGEADPRAGTGVGGRIEIVGRVAGDRAEFDVIDDGPGVPESMRPELFEAFRTRKSTGIGLGLWICWNILERYAGEIRLIESEPGRTVFRVRLPAAGSSARTPSGVNPAGGPGAKSMDDEPASGVAPPATTGTPVVDRSPDRGGAPPRAEEATR